MFSTALSDAKKSIEASSASFGAFIPSKVDFSLLYNNCIKKFVFVGIQSGHQIESEQGLAGAS